MSSHATSISRVLLLILFSSSGLGGCFPYPVQETPHVSGVVVDAATKHPIAGATVHFERYQDKAAVTGSDGRFDIASISRVKMMPMAPYDRMGDRYLLVEAPGHEPARVKASIWRGPSGEKITLKHK